METLKQFLQSNSIPESLHFRDTFFSATMMQRREDLWTNIYAFFLNKNLQHGFNDLFISSFVEVINSKKSVNIKLQESFQVKREEPTKKGNRIDLLISDRDLAIIIENKVGHVLNNDLQDYYDSVTSKAKIGVVLSLQKYSPAELHNNFINITHEELIQYIYEKYKSFKWEENGKYAIFFEEFYKNIINESKTINMEQIKFYLENTDKVNKIIGIKHQYGMHIIKQMNDLREIYESDFAFDNREGKHLYLKSKDNNDLMITIIYGTLLNGVREIQMCVELQNDLLNKVRQLSNFNDFDFDDVEKGCLVNEYTKQKECWGHFALQIFDNFTNTDITKLTKFVSEELDKSAILNIYKKIACSSLVTECQNK